MSDEFFLYLGIALALLILPPLGILIHNAWKNAPKDEPAPTPDPAEAVLRDAAALLGMARVPSPVLYNPDSNEPLIWWQGAVDGRMAGLLDAGMIWIGSAGEKTLYVFKRAAPGGPFIVENKTQLERSPLITDPKAARLLASLSITVNSVQIMADAVEANVAWAGAQAEGIVSDVRTLSAIMARVEEFDPPLVRAVLRGDDAAALALIKSGAGLEATTQGDLNAMTAAARAGRTDLVKALLAAGAQAQPAAGYPLHAAARVGRLDTVEVLLDAGVPVNALDGAKDTVLMAAAGEGHEDVVAFLLSKGADLNALGADQRTALTCAEEEGFSVVAAMLRAAGARS